MNLSEKLQNTCMLLINVVFKIKQIILKQKFFPDKCKYIVNYRGETNVWKGEKKIALQTQTKHKMLNGCILLSTEKMKT